MTHDTFRSSDLERWLPVAGGAVLAACGARWGRWSGVALAAAGVALAYCGLRRACAAGAGSAPDKVCRILDRVGAGVSAGTRDGLTQAAKEVRHPAGTIIDDVVEEASEDSFPASDPPGWTQRNVNKPVSR
jgi:hypothetical protein